VFIVVISMGCMPMSFVDEVGVVPVLHCGMPATRCMLVRVAFGDCVRSDELIIVDQLWQYGRGASASQQV
jgi:hypothetical protein